MIEEMSEQTGGRIEGEGVSLTKGVPRRFTLGWKLFGNLAGIALGLAPVAMILVFCVLVGIFVHPVLGVLSTPVLLVAYLLVYLFVISPFFSYLMASRLVEGDHPVASRQPDAFVVQMSLNPRVCGGIEQILDDADDIGLLFVGKDRLEFSGDWVQLQVPFAGIHRMILDIPSPYRLFLGGRRIELIFHPGGEFKEVTIDSRSGKTILGGIASARRLAATVHRAIDDWVLEANLPESERPALPQKRYPVE